MSWWSVLKKPQMSLREKDYTKFRESQALDALNRILVKDPANNLERVNRVGFRKKGIKGGRSKRPFVQMMTDTALKPETLKELREAGFYVSSKKFKDEAGQDSMGYFIRAESYGGTKNVKPTDEEVNSLTSPQSNPEMGRRSENLDRFNREKEESKLARRKKEEADSNAFRREYYQSEIERNRKPKKTGTPEEIKALEEQIRSLKEQKEGLTGAKAKKMRKRIENEERKLSNLR